MIGSAYLLDSNILLRLAKCDETDYRLARAAASRLRLRGVGLAYSMQNMAEFWNVSTRSIERNGFGLTIEQTQAAAQDIERGWSR